MMTAAGAGNNSAWTVQRIRALAGCILLAGCVLTACGPRFFYDRLDTVAGWYLDELVTLDADQRVSMQRWLAQSLAWHRESQLDRYADFLRALAGELVRPVGYEVFDRAGRQVETFWRDFVSGVLPEAGPLLASLRPEQVDELVESLTREDARNRKEFERRDAEDDLERRTAALRKAVEKWTGSLTAEQKAMVAAAAQELEPLEEARLESRAAWRRELRAVLVRPGGSVAMDDLERLLTDPESAWTPGYRESIAANRVRVLEMLVALDATLSARQRDTMRRRLLDLASDIESMARE